MGRRSPDPGVAGGTGPPRPDGDGSDRVAEAQRRQSFEAVDAAGRRRLVEKTPVNSFRIGYLDALCPDARFVHIIRDGRDVAASISRGWPPPSGGSHRILRPAARFRRRSPRPAGAWYGEADEAIAEVAVFGRDGGHRRHRRVGGRPDGAGIARMAIGRDLRPAFTPRARSGVGAGSGTSVLREPRKTMATVLEGTGLDGGAVVLESAERQVRDPHHRREVLSTSPRPGSPGICWQHSDTETVDRQGRRRRRLAFTTLPGER